MNIPHTLLGDWERRVIEAAKEAASRVDARVYLAGGPVRDLLLGIPLGDLDLVVDGDGKRFASELASELSADLMENERFLTWKLNMAAARHVDLALVRKERYEAHGALPRTQPATSIEEDLHRRDFTINAIALRLDDGALIDPLGGSDDVAAKRVRVLHGKSFVDDPTRIFRALRLAARFEFALDTATLRMLESAVSGGALTTVTPERIWKEIDIACREAKPVRVFRSFAKHRCLSSVLGSTPGALDTLPPDLSITRDLDARVIILGSLLRSFEPDGFPRLPYDEATNRRIRTIAQRDPVLSFSLADAPTPEERFTLCETASAEERFIAAVESTEARSVVDRFTRIASAPLGVRGDDLGVRPGPWIGVAMREARLAVFAGRIDLSEAPAFAREAAMKYLKD